MTEQELSQIPFRMVSHLAMETEHICVYKSQNPLYKILIYKNTKRKKNGEFGKSYTHYVLNGKEYKTKQELLEAINNTDYGKTKESGGNAANDV